MQTSYWSCLTYPHLANRQTWFRVNFLVPQNMHETPCFVQFFKISSVTTCLQLFKIRIFFSLIKFCGLYEKIKGILSF